MSQDPWRTIFTTNDEVEAKLKQGLLEQEGIECVPEASVYRPRSVAPVFNQFKLNVPADQAGRARDILARLEDGDPNPPAGGE